MKYKPEPLANYHCKCGENPLWDDERQLVYWSDIPNGRLFRYDVRTGKHERFYTGDPVGGFTIQSDGALLLFQRNKFSRLHADGRVELLKKDIDDGMSGFNDVIADPKGRVFAGTEGKNAQSGGLYRIDQDGNVTRLFLGTGCSNGMAFSLDHRHLFWTCSTTRKIFRFDYDLETGALGNRAEFINVPVEEGIPDGMTMDSEGNFWSARWDGYSIIKHAPTGKEIDRIKFPVAKVSSLIFGGKELDELYVTTAGGSDTSNSDDGTLYRVKVQAKGLPEFKSKVCL